jgi:hypothetical protein
MKFIVSVHKPGFKHHPHGLPNPTPIVDFILPGNRIPIALIAGKR